MTRKLDPADLAAKVADLRAGVRQVRLDLLHDFDPSDSLHALDRQLDRLALMLPNPTRTDPPPPTD